jgi:hypothetical protein
MAGSPVDVTEQSQDVLDKIQRWLVTEVAEVLERADRLKLTVNIKGRDVRPVIEVSYDSL